MATGGSWFVQGILDLFLDARCAFCQAPASVEEPFFCARHGLAADRFALDAAACPACALPWPRGEGRCSACRDREPPYGELVTAFAYEGHARRALLDAKLARRRALLAPLAQALAERLAYRRWAFGATWVPVPLHVRRRLRRGFNQSAVIAERLAEILGGRVWSGLRRVRATAPQGSLAPSRRAVNLRGAFRVRRGVRRLPRGIVVLVDDVTTSGATLREAARVLRRAGFANLHAATLCRTLPPARRGWRGEELPAAPSEQPHELRRDFVVDGEDEVARQARDHG